MEVHRDGVDPKVSFGKELAGRTQRVTRTKRLLEGPKVVVKEQAFLSVTS